MSDELFVEAKWKTVMPTRQVDLIVWHRMEVAEYVHSAENVAHDFATRSAQNKASAHQCFDSNSRVRCVLNKDIAYAAPGANSRGLHYELAGVSAVNDWGTPEAETMLHIAANQAAEDMQLHRIPNYWRTWEDLVAGGDRARGHTDHWEVTQAFHKTDHTDPGPYFPKDHVLDLCRSALGPRFDVPIVYTFPEDTMSLSPTAGVGFISSQACGLPGNGGYTLTADGGIRAKAGSYLPPAGAWNYLGLPDEDRKGQRYFTAISANEDGSPGYTLWSNEGGRYAFGPGKNGWPT